MIVSQDGSGQWRGQNGEARADQRREGGREGNHWYKVSYGQTPDVKMGQKLGPARAGVIVRLLAVLATHKHSQSPPPSSHHHVWFEVEDNSSQARLLMIQEEKSAQVPSGTISVTMELFIFLYQPAPPALVKIILTVETGGVITPRYLHSLSPAAWSALRGYSGQWVPPELPFIIKYHYLPNRIPPGISSDPANKSDFIKFYWFFIQLMRER